MQCERGGCGESATHDATTVSEENSTIAIVEGGGGGSNYRERERERGVNWRMRVRLSVRECVRTQARTWLARRPSILFPVGDRPSNRWSPERPNSRAKKQTRMMGKDRGGGGGGEAVCPILCHEHAASREILDTAE